MGKIYTCKTPLLAKMNTLFGEILAQIAIFSKCTKSVRTRHKVLFMLIFFLRYRSLNVHQRSNLPIPLPKKSHLVTLTSLMPLNQKWPRLRSQRWSILNRRHHTKRLVRPNYLYIYIFFLLYNFYITIQYKTGNFFSQTSTYIRMAKMIITKGSSQKDSIIRVKIKHFWTKKITKLWFEYKSWC